MIQERMNQELRWLLEEKYGGRESEEAKRDIERLQKGEHVDYVIGWVDFLGCRIDLSQKPFIPRPETEYWTGKLIEELRRQNSRNQAPYSSLRSSPRPNPMISRALSPSLRVLDLFAGSGCIGIAVLKHVPWARVDFAEREKRFLKQIAINAQLNGIAPNRYRLIQSDMLSKVMGKYDYILANPPYVAELRRHKVQQSVRENEPPSAVFGGRDGLYYIRKFLKEAKEYLVPGGVAYLEFDSLQKTEIARLVKQVGATIWEPCKDQYNKWRYARVVF